MHALHVDLQEQVAALEIRMQEARAKLLGAKAESNRLASVHMQDISRDRDTTNFPVSCILTRPPECNRVQQRGGTESGVSGPHVEAHPEVVRGSSVAKWTERVSFCSDLTLHRSSDRCNVS